MKRIFLTTFLFFFNSQVIAEVKTDVRLLCIRNQSAFDVSFVADSKRNNYMMNVWYEAYGKEKKKFEDRGEKITSRSVVDEPYRSIRKENNRLMNVAQEKRNSYVKTLLPILELAGYERPEFYLWYYTAGMAEVRRKHNIIDLNKVEEFLIGQDYYSHSGSGKETRNKLCKLYGFEFNERFYDKEFKRKYGL